MASQSPGRNGSEPSGSPEKSILEAESSVGREGSMTSRGLTEVVCHSGGGG